MTNKPVTHAEHADSRSFEHGADWVRVDFHLHTNADGEFVYEGDADFYISAYVSALESAGIRLGVIANHNKFDYAEFKALRTTARKKGIELLPGVELSISNGRAGIHVLIVFNENWIESENELVNPFLQTMFPGKNKAEYEHENGCSEKTLLQMVEMLDAHSLDYFIVFAHVEEPKGLWHELGMGRLGEWNEKRYDSLREHTLGFQKVRSYDKTHEAGKPCRVKARQALGDWYPAEVEGSDPKNIVEIGKGKPCFIKLGQLSFNALKFALVDPESRVVKEVPKRASSHIRSLHFDGGTLNGKTLHFSPELNTLIGIRGSGKSSILEALRYVLDIPLGEKAQEVKYKEELIRHTLGSSGKITLTACDTYGQEFTVSRIFRSAPDVYLGGKQQPGVTIRETILRKPIYFGQKDLSSTGDGFETDLVEKLVGEKLRPLRAEIANQRRRVREAATRFLKLETIDEQKREYEKQLADADFRLRKFEEYGIATKLHKRVGFQQDSAALKRIRERVENFIIGLNSFLAEHEDDLRNAALYVSTQNNDFFTAYYAEYANVIALFDRLKQVETEMQGVTRRLDARQQEFETARQGLQEEFAAIERQLAEELKQSGKIAIQTDDFLQQQLRKTKAVQMLDALAKQESQKLSIYNSLVEEVTNLNELWRKEFLEIKKELDRVNANHTALQITADFKGDKDAAIKFMQEMFRGSKIRETTLSALMEDYADFGVLYRNIEQAKAKAGNTPETFERYFMQNFLEFMEYQVPNKFTINYRGKELKHHSLGQRASALILYVLSLRQNDVIIIDQPEDDLDNQTIYDDVIKLIREMKPSTQFIFATHNANFPILGDAEQVHACQYQDAAISVQSGGIDTPAIQESIISIMEGGEDAFNKRKEIYNLWKPRNSSK